MELLKLILNYVGAGIVLVIALAIGTKLLKIRCGSKKDWKDLHR